LGGLFYVGAAMDFVKKLFDFRIAFSQNPFVF